MITWSMFFYYKFCIYIYLHDMKLKYLSLQPVHIQNILIGKNRIFTNLAEIMEKKEITSLYLLHIYTADRELAIRMCVSTLWECNKTMA